MCNVRIVNSYYYQEYINIYFANFNNNAKVQEFQENNIAFTTIPHQETRHVKGTGIVSKSELALTDIKDKFIQKISDYEQTIEFGGEDLILFEIVLKTITVTLDRENIEHLEVDII